MIAATAEKVWRDVYKLEQKGITTQVMVLQTEVRGAFEVLFITPFFMYTYSTTGTPHPGMYNTESILKKSKRVGAIIDLDEQPSLVNVLDALAVLEPEEVVEKEAKMLFAISRIPSDYLPVPVSRRHMKFCPEHSSVTHGQGPKATTNEFVRIFFGG